MKTEITDSAPSERISCTGDFLMKADTGRTDHFRLHSGPLDKGDRIYSMGNPRDLRMTIVEGTWCRRCGSSSTTGLTGNNPSGWLTGC